jgi:RNA polymerase sigma-70 factor (ECF subfamily)
MLWDKNELMDTLQMVLSKAYEKRAAFQAGTDFGAWIFRIATNTVFNANRRSARDRERFVSMEYSADLDIVVELQREYAYDELLRNPDRVLTEVGDEMSTALASLSLPERTVFLLKVIADLHCREIAETLEMPMGSVMGYLARSRGKLRSHLAEYARQYGFLRDDVTREESNGV